MDILNVHDELLASAGSSWDDMSEFSRSWYSSEVAEVFKDKVVEILERDFSRSPLFVVKDPRVCRFVPFWLSVLTEFGAEPCFVIPVRNPLEVAASLKARSGFPAAKSFLLWLRHLLDAERDTRGYKRTFVSYDGLLRDWQAAVAKLSQELGISWPRLSHTASAEIETFLRDRYRHHAFTLEEVEARNDVVGWVKRAYTAATAAAEDGTRTKSKTFDAIRAELENADLAYGPLIAHSGKKLAARDTEIERLGEEVARRDEALTARAGEIERVSAERDGEIASLNRAVAAERERLTQLEGTLASRVKELNERVGEAKALRQRVTSLEARLAGVYASRSWRITGPLRAVSRGLRWLLRNTRRALMLVWWLSTGQLSRAAKASLPYYQRFVPLRVKEKIPSRVREVVKRRLKGDYKGDHKGDYYDWIARNDTLSNGDRSLIRSHIASFKDKPKFSILMPVHNTPGEYLRQAIDSVVDQLYRDWELCIVDDASTSTEIQGILEDYAHRDTRIRPFFRDVNGGISACTNTALEMGSGEWIVLMDHDDVLSEHALYLVAEAINSNPDAAIIYSDEDHIDATGRRSHPYFKPDWDYDLFLGQNLINHLGAYRADLARQAGGFREGFEGSQDWDFALRILDSAPNARVHHIPFILYHWRQTDDTFSQTSLGRARDSAQRAVNEHFKRTKQAAAALPEGHSSYLRIRRDLPAERPLVSIVIPTKDQCELLRTCIDGLANRTDYEPVEIVVVDNGSSVPDALAFLGDIRSRHNVKVVEDPRPFNFSRLCNLGVAASTGEICVLLNNDIDVINSDWLDELVSHALRPEVGAVGAKLYYANDTLQHGGVILGLGGVAGHAHRFLPRESPGYLNRLNLTHNLSCVTAACLATRREVYDAIGGFNEQDLTVAFNDVDFCIRVRQAGYRIIWTPNAELYHHESLSRGYETTPEKAARFTAEVAYMRQRWGPVLDNDPFYNPNLSLDSPSFDPGATTRARKPWLEIAADPCPPRSAHSRNRQEASTNDASRAPRTMLDNVGADSRRVSAINFVAVYGEPTSGKSSLSRTLSEIDGFLCLQMDEIFAFQIAPNLANRIDFWSYQHRPEGEMDIGKYIDSDSYDHNLFIACLTEELRRRLQETQNVHVVLLEGYVFKHYSRIFADLGLPPERALALHTSIIEGRHMVEGFDVTGHRYDEVVAHIRQTFRTKCLETTVPKSRYQSFESLGLSQPGSRSTDSNTSAKYEASHLDDVVGASGRFVDIGCNAGYFCFRIADRTGGSVIGVDMARHWLEISSHMNNSIFLRDNIAFFKVEAFDFLNEDPDSFEIIHCASTYHYFRDRQVDFLRAAHRALSHEGTLVLEVELADKGTEPEVIKRSRGVDSTPCAFPNRAMFLEQISGLFQIEAEFESVFQQGSYYNRLYFHLRPERVIRC